MGFYVFKLASLKKLYLRSSKGSIGFPLLLRLDGAHIVTTVTLFTLLARGHWLF